MTIRERLRPKEIFTVPNLLSFVRLLLIPFFVVLYLKYENYIAATGVIIISALTDVVDGRIARRYNMISDFGKFLDPLADKLTQAATIICLIADYSIMWALIALFVVKEALMFTFGFLILKKSDVMSSAKWYGKLNTFVTDTVMCALFLFHNIPTAAANAMIAVCGAFMIGSVALYVRFYIGELKRIKLTAASEKAS